MYGSSAQLRFARHLRGHHDPALFHVDGVDHTLRVHQRHVQDWFRGLAPDPGKWLIGRLGSERTMRVAYEHLRAFGGWAAGPDGMSFPDYEQRELDWAMCRGVADAVCERQYKPGPLRRCRLSKGPGRGERTLRIPNLEDRVVGRAVVEIVQPIFDPVFQPFSFGWRPGRGRLDALAALMAHAKTADHWFWAVDDVADAFDAIPRGRMIAACRQLLPKDVVDFLKVFAGAGKPGGRGLAQGGPASPLLANIHFDAHLDAAWYRRHPGMPLLRTADDLMVCAATARQAEALHADLRRTARSTSGTPLKGGQGSGVRDVRGGDSVDWLGFRIRRVGDKLAVTVGPRAWWKLEDELRASAGRVEPAEHRSATVLGWIDQAGPAYRHEAPAAFCDQLRQVVGNVGIDLWLTNDEVIGRLGAAHARYRKIEKQAIDKLQHQRWRIRDWKARRRWPQATSDAADFISGNSA